MFILDLLAHIASTILVGYLSVTTLVADFIAPLFPTETTPTEIALHEDAPEDDDLHRLPSRYEYGGIIPSILLENAQYQQAAVGANAPTDQATSTPLEIPEEVIARSLVNIFCQYTTDSYIRTTTGTGYFIHANGVILTNAHVAQFLLFENTDIVQDAACTIRSGNPAVAQYKAELLYIPPAWISEHAALVSDETPVGTGERDYALLYVSASATDTPLPTVFPHITINTDLVSRALENDRVFVAGYPGEALFRDGADAKLTPLVAATTVSQIYTFGSNYGDIFSIHNSEVGKHGASGGPIINEDGEAIGLIVTKGNAETEGPQSLRGLTLSYVDRTITEETGFSLEENMRGNLAHRGTVFKEALSPFLAQLLAFELR